MQCVAQKTKAKQHKSMQSNAKSYKATQMNRITTQRIAKLRTITKYNATQCNMNNTMNPNSLETRRRNLRREPSDEPKDLGRGVAKREFGTSVSSSHRPPDPPPSPSSIHSPSTLTSHSLPSHLFLLHFLSFLRPPPTLL